MWALSRPVFVHWAMNIVRERRVMARITNSDSGTSATVISANSGETTIIIASTAATESAAVNSY